MTATFLSLLNPNGNEVVSPNNQVLPPPAPPSVSKVTITPDFPEFGSKYGLFALPSPSNDEERDSTKRATRTRTCCLAVSVPFCATTVIVYLSPDVKVASTLTKIPPIAFTVRAPEDLRRNVVSSSIPPLAMPRAILVPATLL